MRPTLLVSLSGSCAGRCDKCTLKGEPRLLDPRTLADGLDLLKSASPRECVVLCSGSLSHPRAEELIELLSEVGGRLVLMSHVAEARRLTRALISLADEVVLVASSLSDLECERARLRGILSQGYDRVSVWLTVTGAPGDLAKVYSVQSFCRRLGLHLRVGEPPYTNALDVDPAELLLGARKVEVGLFCGTAYGYHATSAFINGYPALLLSKPLSSECRTIYLSPDATVSKCPLNARGVPLAELTERELRRIIYSPCPAKHPSVRLVPEATVYLREVRSGVEIPAEVLMLLETIDQLRSFRAACEALGLSPSTYAEKIKALESKLGFKLLSTARGGSRRGVTLLTAKAKQILCLYREAVERVKRALYDEGYVEGLE